KREEGDEHVGRGTATGARRKTASTKRRGALVPSIRGGHGHLQQGSSHHGSASCVEVARPLRCDPNRRQHARSRRQGGEARAPTHQSGLSRQQEQKTTHDDAYHAYDHAAAEARRGGPRSPAQLRGVPVHTQGQRSLHDCRRRKNSYGGGRLDSYSFDDMAWAPKRRRTGDLARWSRQPPAVLASSHHLGSISRRPAAEQK